MSNTLTLNKDGSPRKPNAGQFQPKLLGPNARLSPEEMQQLLVDRTGGNDPVAVVHRLSAATEAAIAKAETAPLPVITEPEEATLRRNLPDRNDPVETRKAEVTRRLEHLRQRYLDLSFDAITDDKAEAEATKVRLEIIAAEGQLEMIAAGQIRQLEKARAAERARGQAERLAHWETVKGLLGRRAEAAGQVAAAVAELVQQFNLLDDLHGQIRDNTAGVDLLGAGVSFAAGKQAVWNEMFRCANNPSLNGDGSLGSNIPWQFVNQPKALSPLVDGIAESNRYIETLTKPKG